MLVDPHAAERRRNDAPQPGVEAQPRDPPGDDPGIIVAGYAGPAQPFAGEAPSPAEPRSDVDDSDVDADDASYDELDVP
jgi:hypothetical protein